VSNLKILAIGIGKIGIALLKDLVRSQAIEEIVAADLQIKPIEHVVKEVGTEKVKAVPVDATDQDELIDLMQEGFDCVASALLREHQMKAVQAAIMVKTNFVDVGCPQTVFELDEMAKEAEITIVPSCGLDPGIDRFCEGVAVDLLDTVEKINGICGGFPQKNTPGYNNPFRYKASWSWFRAMGTNLGNATILKDGNRVEVPKLDNPEIIRFPDPIGDCEAFYSGASFDVLKHLNLTDVRELWNKTARWPGHCSLWKQLKELKLTDFEPLTINLRIRPSDKSNKFVTPPEGGYVYDIEPLAQPIEISPFEFLNALGDKYLQYEKDEGDAVVLQTNVSGIKNGKTTRISHEMIDLYDLQTNSTAMGRTTAYPASIISQMLARGEIKEQGVVHMSRLGHNPKIAKIFFEEMETRGIHIKETITTT